MSFEFILEIFRKCEVQVAKTSKSGGLKTVETQAGPV